MNNEDNIIQSSGLNRNSNDIILPPGSLISGDECIIVKDNIISRRRGFKLCNTGVPAALPDQLFVSGGILYVHVNNKLYYKDNACTYTLVQGTSPSFFQPSGLWFNSTDLYICDSGNYTVRKINFATNTVSTFAGAAGMAGSADGVGSAARFNAPKYIWGDATNLYVTDNNNYTIRRIVISTATVSTFAGTAGMSGSADGVGAAARFNLPSGIWGNATDLYICDNDNETIRRIDIATATVSTFAGTAGMGGITDGIGAAARFSGPVGIWGDATNLYVTDAFNNNAVRKIVIATAAVTTYAGSSTAGSADGTGTGARFNNPHGIWGDATNLYLCDFGNNTLRKIVIATAVVTTFAGTAGSSGSADGIGSAARFNDIEAVWGDATNLYISDRLNYTIRKAVIGTADVTTYAGQAGVPGSSDGQILSIIQGPT